MKTIQEAHHTWLNPTGGVTPSHFLKGDARSRYLVDLVKAHTADNPAILEIGSNVGRNLNHLWQAGYKNLYGVEINAAAVALGVEKFPARPTMYIGPIEEHIKELPNFDLIYSMCVLMHIHPDSVWVFDEIAKRTNLIITIEDEVGTSDWKWPRNYQEIFEKVGFVQVSFRNCADIDGLGNRYFARVLRKET